MLPDGAAQGGTVSVAHTCEGLLLGGIPDLHGPARRAHQDAIRGGVELQHLHLDVLGAQHQPRP